MFFPLSRSALGSFPRGYLRALRRFSSRSAPFLSSFSRAYLYLPALPLPVWLLHVNLRVKFKNPARTRIFHPSRILTSRSLRLCLSQRSFVRQHPPRATTVIYDFYRSFVFRPVYFVPRLLVFSLVEHSFFFYSYSLSMMASLKVEVLFFL